MFTLAVEIFIYSKGFWVASANVRIKYAHFAICVVGNSHAAEWINILAIVRFWCLSLTYTFYVNNVFRTVMYWLLYASTVLIKRFNKKFFCSEPPVCLSFHHLCLDLILYCIHVNKVISTITRSNKTNFSHNKKKTIKIKKHIVNIPTDLKKRN